MSTSVTKALFILGEKTILILETFGTAGVPDKFFLWQLLLLLLGLKRKMIFWKQGFIHNIFLQDCFLSKQPDCHKIYEKSKENNDYWIPEKKIFKLTNWLRHEVLSQICISIGIASLMPRWKMNLALYCSLYFLWLRCMRWVKKTQCLAFTKKKIVWTTVLSLQTVFGIDSWSLKYICV